MPPVTITPQDAMLWLQVVSILIQTGRLTVEQVALALGRVRGPTDLDTAAADDAALAALRETLAGRIVQARIDAGLGPA